MIAIESNGNPRQRACNCCSYQLLCVIGIWNARALGSSKAATSGDCLQLRFAGVASGARLSSSLPASQSSARLAQGVARASQLFFCSSTINGRDARPTKFLSSARSPTPKFLRRAGFAPKQQLSPYSTPQLLRNCNIAPIASVLRNWSSPILLWNCSGKPSASGVHCS
jgi:hypothetical protein